jgi:hypothetical protein
MAKVQKVSTYTSMSSTTVSDVIQTAVSGVKDAEKKTKGTIEGIDFEMSFVVEKSKGGKADIKVLNYGQEVKEGTTQKMKFRWTPIEGL